MRKFTYAVIGKCDFKDWDEVTASFLTDLVFYLSANLIKKDIFCSDYLFITRKRLTVNGIQIFIDFTFWNITFQKKIILILSFIVYRMNLVYL